MIIFSQKGEKIAILKQKKSAKVSHFKETFAVLFPRKVKINKKLYFFSQIALFHFSRKIVIYVVVLHLLPNICIFFPECIISGRVFSFSFIFIVFKSDISYSRTEVQRLLYKYLTIKKIRKTKISPLTLQINTTQPNERLESHKIFSFIENVSTQTGIWSNSSFQHTTSNSNRSM